jgi:hypothetical protein
MSKWTTNRPDVSISKWKPKTYRAPRLRSRKVKIGILASHLARGQWNMPRSRFRGRYDELRQAGYNRAAARVFARAFGRK